MEYCMILTTCPDDKSARKLAAMLVESQLAACVQLSAITSFYCWQGKQHSDPEIRLTIKTKNCLYKKVEEFIKTHHSYDVPQIVQIPIEKGSTSYLDWMDQNTINQNME